MRGIAAAICGLVVACALALPSGAQTPQEREAAQTQASIDKSLRTIAQAASKTAEPAQVTEYESPCGEGEDNRKSDLCAQWKAAKETENGAIWGFWQTILSALGILGLLYNLHLTRTAVKSAIEASQSVLISDRAWLLPDVIETIFVSNGKVGNVDIKNGIGFRVIFLNSGATPAIHIGVQITHDLIYSDGTIITPFDEPTYPLDSRNSYTAPNGRIVSGSIYLTDEETLAFRQMKLRVRIKTVVEYADIFQPAVTHRTVNRQMAFHQGGRMGKGEQLTGPSEEAIIFLSDPGGECT